jgi:hypothetical protein
MTAGDIFDQKDGETFSFDYICQRFFTNYIIC